MSKFYFSVNDNNTIKILHYGSIIKSIGSC